MTRDLDELPPHGPVLGAAGCLIELERRGDLHRGNGATRQVFTTRMNRSIHRTADLANAAAADLLVNWFSAASGCNLMVAGGHSPLNLYGRIAERRLRRSQWNIFTLDEYVGVPPEEPRNCANLLRRAVAEAWGVPLAQFFALSSLAEHALASVQTHEERIARAGGLDIAVLGLGQNGHLGFNEPGSKRDSVGRLVALEPTSIAANRQWFRGDYAPSIGVTVGLKTILAARHVLVLAYGAHKAVPVKEMVQGPPTEQCPASFLQDHPNAWLFVDAAAAERLSGTQFGREKSAAAES